MRAIFFKVLVSLIVLAFLALAMHNEFCPNSSRSSDNARAFAYAAAEAGLTDLAIESLKYANFDKHKANINASIAFSIYKDSPKASLDFANKAKPFDKNSFLKRKIVFDIGREPDFMAGLLEYKYVDSISEISNIEDRILPLYVLGEKIGLKGERYKSEAFRLLDSLPKDDYKTELAMEVMKESLSADKPEDFYRAFKDSLPNFELDNISFHALLKKNFADYIKQRKDMPNDKKYLLRFLSAKQSLQSGDVNKFGEQLIYMPLRYGFAWECGTLRGFNYPTLALIAKLYKYDNIAQTYISKAQSDEIIEVNYKGLKTYIPFLVAVLLEFEMRDDAVKIAYNYPQLRDELVSVMLKNPPKDRRKLEQILNIIRDGKN